MIYISPVKIIGSLVYRTRKALNENSDFMNKAKTYAYANNCIVDDKFSLWHYPGTPSELSAVLNKINEHPNGIRLKYPSFFNFQPVRQNISANRMVSFNLAITASVLSSWLTEERDNEVFDKILRPIYTEFINQVNKCEYFQSGYGDSGHTIYERYTTDSDSGYLVEKYGDYIDAIEIHNISLIISNEICEKHLETIEKENLLVTENFKKILNFK